MTWYVRGHHVYEKHVEVSFPWGKINHSQNECWSIVWFVHTYYSSIWQDSVGIAKSSVKCSRKTKKWRMLKSYVIAYICICVVVPKISGMLPWKCWEMRQKKFTLEKIFDFFRTRIFYFFLLLFDFSQSKIDFLLTFYVYIQYEHTLFFGFSGTILWINSQQKVKKRWTKSQRKVNFFISKSHLKSQSWLRWLFSPFLEVKSIKIDFSD